MTASTAGRRVRLIRLGVSEEYGSAQLLLSAVVVLAPVAFIAAMILAGSEFTWWFLVFTPLTAVGAARPESTGHLVLWVLLLVLWVAVVPGPFTWWSVPAALAIATSHTALVLLGGRPTSGDLAADTWERVRHRLAVVGGITVGVAVLAQLVRSLRAPGQLALAVAALVAVSLWLWWGTRRTQSDESEQ
ncbi:MAG: hypothetical protein ABJA74_05510 [Lapillicoccus sp.]